MVGLVLAALIGISAALAQEIRPPLLQIGQMDAVSIDGRISEGEWEGAIDAGVFVGPDARPTDLPVRVRMGWDEEGLALLWELGGDPVAMRRERDGDIWRDDSVEVRLRADEDGPVHRFAINAAGSIHDARAGDRAWDAPWRALALRGSDGWRVEMHIPFASIGGRPGDALRANLVVHDAQTNKPAAAWAGLGEEGDESFGFLRLAASPSPVTLSHVDLRADAATVLPVFSAPAGLRATLFDGDDEVQTIETGESAALEITLPRPGEFRLRLAGSGPDGELVLQREFPLVRIAPLVLTARKRLLDAREIDLQIDGAGLPATPDVYLITAPGAQPVEVSPDPGHATTATVDLSHCPPGELTVGVAALAGGDEIAAETLSLVLPPRPEWAGSTRGMHGPAMAPQTPVEVIGSRVRCGEYVYDPGDGFLPASIRAGRTELLAGPIMLRARVGATMRDWTETTVRWLETGSTHATATILATSPLADARVRTTFHHDGLMTFDVRVRPHGERSLSEVRLEIPVAAEFATHMQIAGGAGGAKATAVPRGGHVQGFAPMVWLTGPERGLQWSGASDTAWALAEPGEALRISLARGRTTLVVTMLDRELLPRQPFDVSFALQATPAGEVREDRGVWRAAILPELPLVDGRCDPAVIADLRARGVRTVVLDDADYRPRPGGLGEAADVALAALAQQCHEAGLALVLAIDDDLTSDPVWEAFRDEVECVGADDQIARPCPGSAWADYVVEAAAYAMEHYDADGIHLRGGASPRVCRSPSHGGREDGDPAAGCAVMGARTLMMRLRTVVRESKPEGILTVELPEGTPAVAAYADAVVIASGSGGSDAISLDEFIARGGSGALGTAVEVALGATDDHEALSRAVGMAVLHDAALRPVARSVGLDLTAAVREAQEQFGVGEARWRPWWSDRSLLSTEAQDVRVSTWRRGDELLAAVANLGDDQPVVELHLDRARMKLGPRVTAIDLLTGQAVPAIGEVLRTRMGPGEISLVHVRTRQERNVEINE
jgi:hypothetical protein